MKCPSSGAVISKKSLTQGILIDANNLMCLVCERGLAPKASKVWVDPGLGMMAQIPNHVTGR